MSDIGGYAGKLLNINLTTGVTKDQYISKDIFQDCIGGVGLGSRLLLENYKPNLTWDHPDNPLMFMCGPLSATIAGTGIICIITQGPMTGLTASSQANGFWGAYLKTNGYDGIILNGKAPEWVYIVIDEGNLKILPAMNLLGLDTYEIKEAITSALLIRKKFSVLSIGIAGENQVKYSIIAGDYGHVAAHNGVGAVMGAKMVKALAVTEGNYSIKINDPEGLKGYAKKMFMEASKANNSQLKKYGTAGSVKGLYNNGVLPIKNYNTNVWEHYHEIEGQSIRTKYKHWVKPCWKCGLHCKWMEIIEGEYAGFKTEEPDYEGIAACSSLIDNKNTDKMLILSNTIDRLGLDVNETGWILGWVMEGFEKGWFNKEILGGIELAWGDVEGAIQLVQMIAKRQGIGQFLSEGIRFAAQSIGGEAERAGIYTLKGSAPRTHDHRGRWNELFDTCMSNTGTIEVTGGTPNYDELGIEPPRNKFDPDGVARTNAQINGYRQFQDCVGICRFVAPKIVDLIGCINSITGWGMTIPQAMTIGKRAVNRMRIYNLLNGLDYHLEYPSPRYGSAPIDGPAAGISILDSFDNMRSIYYKYMGWDQEGRPLVKTLKHLSLEEWINELGVRND